MLKKILKFGGTSVGTIERIQHVAKIIKKEYDSGNKVIAIVSAMSGKTNELIKMSKSIDEELSSGNLISGSPLYEINEIISDSSLDQEKLENKIEAVLSNTEPVYEKNLSTVKLLAAVAPLLGLLGTVIGMIETFQAITLFGTGDPKLMADGISQALVTTMLGLITAVPLLFVHNQLDTRSREIVQIIEEQAIGRLAAKNN